MGDAPSERSQEDGKSKSPQEKASTTRKNKLTRTTYYAEHQRTPYERVEAVQRRLFAEAAEREISASMAHREARLSMRKPKKDPTQLLEEGRLHLQELARALMLDITDNKPPRTAADVNLDKLRAAFQKCNIGRWQRKSKKKDKLKE